jgi:hypothetical protein
MKDLARVEAALGHLDRSLTYSGNPDFAVESEDLDILQHAKAQGTIRRLAWGHKTLDPQRLRAVYGLLISGALRDPADAGTPADPLSERDAASRGASALAATRREVRDEMARSETLDHVTWLGISPNAGPAEIIGALEKRKARYESLRVAAGGDAELNTDLELLTGRVSMALRLARRAR